MALVKYGGKVSGKDKSIFLEAEFIVLSSTNELVKPGARHSWPWFVNKPDEYGYTRARAKDFLVVLQQCIGNEEEAKAFGNALNDDFEADDPQAYGVVLEATVTPVTDAKGLPRRGKKGNEVYNVTWNAIAQDAADIAATRATLTEMAEKATPTIATKVAKPDLDATPSSPPPQTNGKKLGGLGMLIGKR